MNSMRVRMATYSQTHSKTCELRRPLTNGRLRENCAERCDEARLARKCLSETAISRARLSDDELLPFLIIRYETSPCNLRSGNSLCRPLRR